MIYYIIAIVILRIFTDFVFPYDKPTILQYGYTASLILLIILNIRYIQMKQLKLILLLILATLYSLFASVDILFEQMEQNLKVILAPIAIIILSQNPKIDFQRGRDLVTKYFPYLIILLLFFFFGNYDLRYLLNDFANNPFHNVAQVIAKISLLFVNSNYAYLFLGTLFILNVRSNFIPILFINLKKYFKKNYGLFTIVILIGISLYLLDFNSILERVFYKGRLDQDNGLNEISSGRIEIILDYFDYIWQEFSFFNYLFGAGNLYLQGEMRLSAHNDLLNLLVDYGVIGIYAIYIVYKDLYENLNENLKSNTAIYFIFVFITNGILFHQSNIIFALYLKNKDKLLKETEK